MTVIVDLDAPCGRHLKYRDLIECGNTWRDHVSAGTPIDNLPREAASLAALRALCEAVLDPLIDHFGPVTLTYGFASSRLTRKIGRRIAPKLDQHAACEIGRTGGLVCPRQGAAVDLVVPGQPAMEVARWIAHEAPFDRLYLFDEEGPLHVSHGPEQSRVIFTMQRGPSGRRFPRRLHL